VQQYRRDAGSYTKDLQRHPFGDNQDCPTLPFRSPWQTRSIHCDCCAEAALHSGWRIIYHIRGRLLNVCSLRLSLNCDCRHSSSIHNSTTCASRRTAPQKSVRVRGHDTCIISRAAPVGDQPCLDQTCYDLPARRVHRTAALRRRRRAIVDTLCRYLLAVRIDKVDCSREGCVVGDLGRGVGFSFRYCFRPCNA